MTGVSHKYPFWLYIRKYISIVPWQGFSQSLFGVCRSGRLVGRCCCLWALSGTANYIFPQMILTWLEGVCLSTRSAVTSLGAENAPHNYHCSFIRGDWFPCECMCARMFKKNLQHLNCRFLSSTAWKHSEFTSIYIIWVLRVSLTQFFDLWGFEGFFSPSFTLLNLDEIHFLSMSHISC